VESRISFSEAVSQRIVNLSDELRAPIKEVVKGLETANEKRVELALKKISSSDSFTLPEGKEQIVGLAQILFLCVRESYASPKTDRFEIYTSVLPLFAGFLSNHARHPELCEFPKLLFCGGEQFTLAYYDDKSNRDIGFENFYEFHLQNLRDFLRSPGFKGWKNQAGIADFLSACITRWVMHLGNFVRNRREKPFLTLLDLLLMLFRIAPELEPAFHGLAFVLPCAKKAFHYIYAEGEDSIKKVFMKAKPQFLVEQQQLVSDWMEVYTLGALPDVPRACEMEESPELTVPFVYRALLEEILGDGTISSDEEWVIKSVRDFLEISNEKYNKIFDQVLEGRKLNKIPILDRDFSPRVFLNKILTKTVEDGVVTDEEKSIIGKVANSLLLNQTTLDEVLIEVKQALNSTVPKPQMVDKDTEKLHDLVRYIAMEERVRSVLVSERGMKIYYKAGKVLAALRRKAKESGGEKSGELMSRWAVAAFFYEPQVYLYPTIILFMDAPNVHPLRLAFKGARVGVEFSEEVQSKSGEDTSILDSPLLLMHNDCLDSRIPIKALIVGESIANFIDGIEETKGKYAVMLMHQPLMGAIAAFQKNVYLDFFGNFALARKNIADGKFDDAIALLAMIHEGFPDRLEILHCIGEAHERAFESEPLNEGHRRDALAAYKAELELNPTSDKSIRGIGRLLASEGRYDEALFWFDKAYNLSPACISNLLSIVETSINKVSGTPGAFVEIPQFILKYLAEAYQIWPSHPGVVKMIDDMNKKMGVDLLWHFRNQPVQTFFQ